MQRTIDRGSRTLNSLNIAVQFSLFHGFTISPFSFRDISTLEDSNIIASEHFNTSECILYINIGILYDSIFYHISTCGNMKWCLWCGSTLSGLSPRGSVKLVPLSGSHVGEWSADSLQGAETNLSTKNRQKGLQELSKVRN